MDKYIRKIKKYTEIDLDDVELKHIAHDKILRSFIIDIVNNKLTNNEIRLISKEINNKIINDKDVKVFYYS